MQFWPGKKEKTMLGAADAKGRKAGDQQENSATVEAICTATWEPLYRFVYYKTYNREEAEDITQETYVRALPRIREGGVQPDRTAAYLRATALNVLRDRWRKKKRQGTPANIESIHPEEASAPDPTESSVEREALREALNRLGETYRRVVEHRILNGYSVAETAKLLGETEANVRVLQYRALQTLSTMLEATD
jgi:RNA polymerase sigma-70 factor (ECF subfamily)